MSATIRTNQSTRQARLLGVGGYRPARVVTNAEICERIDSSDEWIRTRSGIATPALGRRRRDRRRHEQSPRPARRSAHAGITPDQVGCVIVATVTHLCQTPSAAAEIAYQLGTDRAAAFDISAACAGFCYGVSLANDMVRGGTAEHVLVIGVERLSDFTDPTDRSTAFIFGDGAGAVVIGPSDEPGIGPAVWGSDGQHADLIRQRERRGSTRVRARRAADART